MKKVIGIILDVILGLIILFFIFELITLSTSMLCQVDGESMLNTLRHEQFLVVNRVDKNIKRGDIVVIYKSENLVKRVVAVGGDKVKFVRDGEYVDLYVNGEKVDESGYIKERMLAWYWSFADARFGKCVSLGHEFEVDEGCYYALGDNRNNSADSRREGIGQITAEEVGGRVDILLEEGTFLEWLYKLIFGVFLRGDSTTSNALIV